MRRASRTAKWNIKWGLFNGGIIRRNNKSKGFAREGGSILKNDRKILCLKSKLHIRSLGVNKNEVGNSVA